MSQALSADQLRVVLTQTLSPDASTRREAEKHLSGAKATPGHPLEILRIVASSDAADAAVRQAAAIHFKNVVKKGWDESAEDGTDGIIISQGDRNLIKSHLVELMCTVPPQIQSQCSEAISLIALVDFPSKWDNLLPELVQKFNSPDPNVVAGVLVTANSIFKRFRYTQRSDGLYTDILYVLKILQAPLLTLFKTIGVATEAYRNDANQLRPRFAALRTISRIFFSLNWQDLPEYFEDHMGEWMAEFEKYLVYENPLLTDEDEESESSPIDVLQTAVIDNLMLYANKDEEPFIPFLGKFTSLVWNLLLKVSSYPKHDTLATTSIKFLSSLVSKKMHMDLFKDEGTLRQIISKIVIPNLMIREVDEEKFEDDPQEYILGDMEGNDTESRRKCSQALLKAMCRQFEDQTTIICTEHITSMLNEFQSDPSNKWVAKDVAIHLMMGVSIQLESATHGVSSVNSKVNIMEFFSSNILTELQETNQAVRPMLKATAIKFVTTFRAQFTKEHLLALMPLLTPHLSSSSIVVHTYAASAIEKIFTIKQEISPGVRKTIITGGDIQRYLEPLFTGLFTIIDNPNINENEYIMKCVMRSLQLAKDDIVQITQIVLEKLTAALARVAKNPRNPQYNHYLFESIAVLVRSVCSQNSDYTNAFEGLLFPPFQTVLQMDVVEFTPYVYQVLAQILEFRAESTGLGDAYTMLLPPVITPTLWERKGNIPALTRLLTAYLQKGFSTIVSQGHLVGVLGVFQKLIASKSSEISGFELLRAIVQYVPAESLQEHFKGLLQILLMRLQHGKTARYIRLVTDFFALFIGKYEFRTFNDLLDSIQPGLGIMLFTQVWIPRLQTDVPTSMDAKIQVVGLTNVLCDTNILMNNPNGQQIWSKTLEGVLKVVVSPNTNFGVLNDDGDAPVEIGYDATFSRLYFASKPQLDPFSTIGDPVAFFAKSLHTLCSSNPGKFPPLIQQTLQPDPKLSASFDNIFQRAGLNIV